MSRRHLSPANIFLIKKDYLEGFTAEKLAKRYSVTPNVIHSVLRGKTYVDIKTPYDQLCRLIKIKGKLEEIENTGIFKVTNEGNEVSVVIEKLMKQLASAREEIEELKIQNQEMKSALNFFIKT